MTSRIRPFLTAAAILAAAAFFPPDACAQGFGGMFSSFNLNGVSGDEMEASTVITANSADIDLENNVIVLIGDVVVDDKSSKITCNRMEIYLDEDAADSLVGTADKPEDEAGPAGPDPKLEKEAEDDEDGDAPEEEEDRKNIRRIDCVGDVVFRKRANPNNQEDSDEDQIAMAARADYDVIKDVIVMTGAHSAPEKVIPGEMFEIMVRQIRSSNIARCPVMMQGENWMVGESFTILLQEDNRLKVKDMRFNYIGDDLLPGDAKDGTGDSAAASGDRKSKSSTLISANDADIYIEHNIITLTGNVDVDQESDQPVRMTCDKMEIILVDDVPEKDGKSGVDSGKKASEIHCTGEFVYRKRAGQDSTGEKDQIALSDRADYDAEKDILVLSGKPIMIQGANKVHGARIAIYPKEDNRMSIDSMKAYYTGSALLSAGDDSTAGAMTLIAAARADIRPDELITLSKNVVVDDGSTQITCAKMDISLQKGASGSNSLFSFGTQTDKNDGENESEDDFGKEVSQIICTGDFVYRRTSGGKEQTAMSDKAEYDAVSKTILLTEKPVIMQGLTKIYGSRIEIVQEKDNAHVDDMKMLYSDKPLFTIDKKSEEGTTTTITAKKADIDMKGSIAYLKGGVDVFDDFHKIVCKEMDVHFRNDSDDADGKQDEIAFENNSISEILCRGNVVYMDRNMLEESYGENRIALSEEARFDGETGKLHMNGAHSTPKEFLSENLYEDALQGILHIMDENDAYRPTSWTRYDKNKKRTLVEERLQRHTIAVDEEKRVFLGESIDVFTKDTNHITVLYSYNRLYGFTFFQSVSSDRKTDDDSERPVDIAASFLDYNNNEILLRENVVIDDGVSKITCEKMKLFLTEDTEDSTSHANNGKSEIPDAVPTAVPVAGINGNESKKKDRDDNFLGSKSVSSAICAGNFTFLRRNKTEDAPKEDLLVLSRFAEYHKDDNMVRASNRPDEHSTFTETENEKRGMLFYKEFISDEVSEKITKKMIEDFTKEPIKYGAPRNWLLYNDLEKEKYCEGEITESVVAIQGTEWAIATEFMFSPDLSKRRFNGIKHTSGLLKNLSNTFK